MPSADLVLPLIDLAPYLSPDATPSSKATVIAQVRAAVAEFGFFQVINHGIPLASQHALIEAIRTLMRIPKEDKLAMSFLKNPCRRGYEGSGDTFRTGDKMHDAKEAFYIGRPSEKIEPPGFHGPNIWPSPELVPEAEFRDPVWSYYQETNRLGREIWQLLIQGLGHPGELLSQFTKKPVVMMKMIRYPPFSSTLPGQFGVGAHTDFGGVTVLLQEAGRNGLEVEHKGEWIPVPALENVLVINAGDMIAGWSGGVYQSAKHRVINKGEEERISCATFWHGDLDATNPFIDGKGEGAAGDETVADLLVKRFRSQFSLMKGKKTEEVVRGEVFAH
ncbi:uncharacterized protein QC763_506790 [Podospora pseudopauciseta]|uniref:Fe2OG dioxygenase domain-containing protein n=3 Tax=Podospora TaxID=5144 RepID=A0ABR0H9P6_9PEZI|nr:hypothetical protein QC761_506790 [Podospora bellae-mahoneyi]KAK4664729.1 hypothetical protein QC763_506790 [Podospora pseudopauciseta]KAK4675882.1 hypothetical protein QC764_506790 [Podospora pseudoanserina]